jgi:helix-turn-helix protein
MPSDTLLDVAALMERLDCSKSTAYGLLAGVLQTVRLGRALRVRESVVEAFIAGGGVRSIPRNGHAPPPPAATTKPAKTRKRSR